MARKVSVGGLASAYFSTSFPSGVRLYHRMSSRPPEEASSMGTREGSSMRPSLSISSPYT